MHILYILYEPVLRAHFLDLYGVVVDTFSKGPARPGPPADDWLGLILPVYLPGKF